MTDSIHIEQQMRSLLAEQRTLIDECEVIFKKAEALALQGTLKHALVRSLSTEIQNLAKNLEA